MSYVGSLGTWVFCTEASGILCRESLYVWSWRGGAWRWARGVGGGLAMEAESQTVDGALGLYHHGGLAVSRAAAATASRGV